MRSSGQRPHRSRQPSRWAGVLAALALLLILAAFALAWRARPQDDAAPAAADRAVAGEPVVVPRTTREPALTATAPAPTPTTTEPTPPPPDLIPDLHVLWLDSCDPRTDPEVCHLSDSVEILTDFLGVLAELDATLDYRVPIDSAALFDYDVVIANFCGPGGRALGFLQRYLEAGGSVIAMGDAFCRGVDDGQGNWVASADLVDQLAAPWGVRVDNVESNGSSWAYPTEASAADARAIMAGVVRLYLPRPSIMALRPPAMALAEAEGEPRIALVDSTGTLVVIPRIGFAWSLPEAPPHDNFRLWRNLLSWMGGASRTKLVRPDEATPAAIKAGATVTPLTPPPYIQVGRQVIGPVGQIVIAEVHAPDGGWLALHEGGPDGPVLTQRLLQPGVSDAVSFSLATDALPAALWAVLHEDSGAPGFFDFPDADLAVTWRGETVAAPFGIEVITPTPWHTPTPWATVTPWVTPTP